MPVEYILKGNFIDTPKIGNIRTRKGYLHVKSGLIVDFYKSIPHTNKIKIYDFSNYLIVPGLIDLHLHAPQYNFVGTGMDLDLLDWLNAYTFKEEAKFVDLNYAKKSYRIFINELIKSPTTRACMFASIYTDSTIELMKELEKHQFISYVGKVSMDINSPDYYVERDGINETIRFLDKCKSFNFNYVYPIITPRFTPSVSDEYMKALGKMAKDYRLPIQSHLSENVNEIKLVHELHPSDEVYATTYSKYGLFGNPNKTIMAHCIHSNDIENKMLKENNVFIAHCPTSNLNLVSGICPAAMYLRNGYNIGLGSDVAGGNTLNLFEVMKIAIQSSKARFKYISDEYKPLELSEVLYLATVCGGRFFGSVGLFEPNYEFDAIVLDDSNFKSARKFSLDERLERFIYVKEGKIIHKFIKGNKIF